MENQIEKNQIEKNQIKSNVLFGLMQGFIWATYVCFNVFLVFYLKTLHISSSQIGLLLTVGMVAGVISQYVWGYICDRLKGVKKVITICIVGTIVAVWSLPVVQGFHAILAIYIVFMVFQPVIPSLIDTWIIQFSQSTCKNYSKLRGIGSLVFAVMSSFFGILVQKYFYHAMAIGFTVLSMLLFIVVLFSKDITREIHHHQKGNRQEEPASVLFKNIKFIALLLGLTFIFICLLVFAVMSSFFCIFVQ